MLVLSSFILFAFRVAFVFSIGENLFLASNDEVVDPLSASIFGSGGAGSGNLFETSIDEGSSAPFDIALGGPKVAEPYIDLEGSQPELGSAPLFDFQATQDLIDWKSDEKPLDFTDGTIISETGEICVLDNPQTPSRLRVRESCRTREDSSVNSVDLTVPLLNAILQNDQRLDSARAKLGETLQEAFPGVDLGTIQLKPICTNNIYGDATILVCSSGDPVDVEPSTQGSRPDEFNLFYCNAVISVLDYITCTSPREFWCCRNYSPPESRFARKYNPPRSFATGCKRTLL